VRRATPAGAVLTQDKVAAEFFQRWLFTDLQTRQFSAMRRKSWPSPAKGRRKNVVVALNDSQTAAVYGHAGGNGEMWGKRWAMNCKFSTHWS
jgi:hypothetical protein